MTRKNHRWLRALGIISLFVVVFILIFFGIQFLTKTGVFKIPGVVNYDDSLNADELGALESIFTEEVVLDKDVLISARTENILPELGNNEFLYEVMVPVVDFYETSTDVSDYEESEVEYIPVSELDFTQKLLTIDGNYYLDSFESGARFRIITFESEKYTEEIEPLVRETFERTFPQADTVLTLAQTGVTALSRGMNAKLANVGDVNYFAENIGGFLAGFDLTHTSNEASFTNYATTANICSDERFFETLLAIGLDIVELTGNHNQDCGDEAASATIDLYRENDIQIVGGGKTAEEAAVPLEIQEEGNHLTFLAYNLSTGGATNDNTPGANQYDEERAAAEISAAKARGDFVLVDVQYYECSAYDYTSENTACDYANSAAGDQIGFFRHLIDLGADMVVGTAAHQPQTFELYEDGVIYYGLGNLFFDQIWWPGTTRSLILGHYFYQGKLLQTKISPTIYDDAMQTTLMDEIEAAQFLDRLIEARP
ncbi:CapA family protein [Candidatus Saccharibacteria bacterium]|nr:CapA family protein [Candidatus Saccharibacteria bacterium]